MDGVSRGLMMRVAVCGWGAVRREVHESADRGRAQERERSASAEGGQAAEARRGVHIRAWRRGGGSDDDRGLLHRGSVPL